MTTPTKTEILAAMRGFIEARPGFDPANYISRGPSFDRAGARALRADQRRATRQLNDARALLTYIDNRDSITADMLLTNLRGGRLTWDRTRGQLDYCTGQYYPVEYRAAAARVLAGTIWDWIREECLPPTADGDDIRAAARRELGRAIAARYFA